MQVARYWRNRKFRYRLARETRIRPGPVANAAPERDGHADAKPVTRPQLAVPGK